MVGMSRSRGLVDEEEIGDQENQRDRAAGDHNEFDASDFMRKMGTLDSSGEIKDGPGKASAGTRSGAGFIMEPPWRVPYPLGEGSRRSRKIAGNY